MKTGSATVIIVNWNGGKLLEECLLRLTRQTLPPAKILVVDNGSADDSADRAERIAGVTVRRTGKNLGFAAANNLALQECDTDLVALLNPDAFAESDWLERLVAAAQARPDVAAFGSRQMAEGYEDTLDGIGDVYHLSGLAWRSGHGRKRHPSDGIARAIFSPCAGAALFRREALREAGGFDEDFFCYVEDVDLGFRLRLAGHKAMYVPDAVVHHVGSALSGGRHSDFSVYHGHRNLAWVFVKNMPGPLFWLLLPAHLLLTLATLAYFSARGKGELIFRAKWDAVKGIPAMWAKRRAIQDGRRAKIADIWRALDKRLVFSRTGAHEHS
jgi:GT2 family glycosyltransferase